MVDLDNCRALETLVIFAQPKVADVLELLIDKAMSPTISTQNNDDTGAVGDSCGDGDTGSAGASADDIRFNTIETSAIETGAIQTSAIDGIAADWSAIDGSCANDGCANDDRADSGGSIRGKVPPPPLTPLLDVAVLAEHVAVAHTSAVLAGQPGIPGASLLAKLALAYGGGGGGGSSSDGGGGSSSSSDAAAATVVNDADSGDGSRAVSAAVSSTVV
jgi:hypothetical protein